MNWTGANVQPVTAFARRRPRVEAPGAITILLPRKK